MAQSAQRRLLSRMAAAARELAGEWSGRDFGGVTPDTVAQAAVCGAPILASGRNDHAALNWLCRQLAPWESFALEQALRPSLSPSLPFSPSPSHLYDAFLHHHARDRRKRHGVFFTPQPIADYIVRRIDAALRNDFGLPGGLADDSAFRTPHSAFLLDPACGTGVFLLAVIDFLHSRLADCWNELVPALLPRLIGIELLPAAAFLAKLNIALQLAETGYDFRQPGSIQIHTADALDPNLQFAICNLQSAIPVLLGNPPFSSLSTNTNDWIAGLVRGDGQTRGYLRAGDERLGERKTWLHDDYVKFIRLAQWHVEQAGRGIVGLVTSSGYLSNATFRLMRQELLRVFPRIEILDLHGSRKAHEVAPDGGPDENVFGLAQGVAIGIFSRPATPTRSVSEGLPEHRLTSGDLWGSRDAKLAALSNGHPVTTATAAPAPPDFRFTSSPHHAGHPEYAAAWSLAEAMPLNATAPVTARDHFVVAFTQDELRQRVAEFRDLAIPDDEIRRRYFQRTRSARYETGDTRGWKLAAARRAVAADADWETRIVRCLYRPFDWRHVFWHPAMIDWPRAEVTRHLIEPSCLCLLARRQQLPTQPCTFFWIADGLALDGVIRSDNRGSESLFPLYVRELSGWRANFAPQFVAQAERAADLGYIPLGCGDLARAFGPEDLLAYIYALFHAPTYRARYAAALVTGFPRVLLAGGECFRTLARCGRELIDLHLLRNAAEQSGEPASLPQVAAFRAGGYVALRKWLQPRHRSPADPQYGQIAAAIARTLELMGQIDGALGLPQPGA